MPADVTKPTTPPDISDIPQSSQLHQQLSALNSAIAALQAGGNVSFMTVRPAPPPSNPDGSMPPPMMMMEIRVELNPPISDPTVIAGLVAGLQAQADAISQQLTDMGYTNDPARRRK